MTLYTGQIKVDPYRRLEDFEAPLGDYLSAKVEQGWQDTVIDSASRYRDLDEAMYGRETISGGAAARFGLQTTREAPDSPLLDAGAAAARLESAGLTGKLEIPASGIRERALSILIERKRAEIARQDVITRSPNSYGWIGVPVQIAVGIADPVNVAASFVPLVGPTRYAAMLARAGGAGGRAAVRAGVGAAEGVVGSAALEPFVYTAKAQEQADYGMADALLNVAFGGLLGGGLHAVGGAVADRLASGRWPAPPPGSGAETAARAGHEAQEAATRTAVDQAMAGQRVDVEGVMGRTADIGADLEARIAADFPAARREYEALADAEGGRVLNVDTARELSPEYRADRTRSADVHEASSAFVKRLYKEKLAELPPNSRVLFTAGGTGSGKSSAIAQAGAKISDVGLIYDTNMNGLQSSAAKIDQALAAGHRVDVVFVHRDPIESLTQGALPRAMRMGRTVPLAEHVRTHRGARETVEKLAERYAGDERVTITAVDNSRGRGNATVVDLDALPHVDYNGIDEAAQAALAAEHQAGRISDAVYRGTAGASGTARALAPSRANAGGQSEPPRQSTVSDPEAADAATRQLETAPKTDTTDDAITAVKAMLADDIARLQSAIVVRDAFAESNTAAMMPPEIADELRAADELVAEAEAMGRGARALAACLVQGG